MHSFFLTYPWYEVVLMVVFMVINLLILESDIQYRRIPNTLLFFLIGGYPLWFLTFEVDFSVFGIYILFSFLLLIAGIIGYKKGGFVGSGDLKYAAVLLPLLGYGDGESFIGNIGLLTLIVCVGWLGFLIGKITSIQTQLPKGWLLSQMKHIPKKIRMHKSDILLTIVDFLCIGWILMLLTQDIFLFVRGWEITSRDLPFLISISIFLARPMIHGLYRHPKYGFPIIGLSILYVLSKNIELGGIEGLWISWRDFVYAVGGYVLLFMSTMIFSKGIFFLYDQVFSAHGERKHTTFPFSIIIFLAFISTYFLDISLIGWIKNNF